MITECDTVVFRSDGATGPLELSEECIGTFTYCETFTKRIEIHREVERFPVHTFRGSGIGLKELVMDSPKVPEACRESFDVGECETSIFDSCTLYVPSEALAAYRSAPGWSEFRDIRPIRSNLTSVSGDVYAGPTAVYSSTGVLLRTLPEGTEADDACRDLPAGVYVVRGPEGVRKVAR